MRVLPSGVLSAEEAEILGRLFGLFAVVWGAEGFFAGGALAEEDLGGGFADGGPLCAGEEVR